MFYVVRGLTAIINRKHLENRKSYTKMNFQLLLATTEILSIPWADAWERGWKGSKVRRINRSPTILDCFQTSISTTVQCFLHILYYTHIVSDNSIRLVFFDFLSTLPFFIPLIDSCTLFPLLDFIQVSSDLVTISPLTTAYTPKLYAFWHSMCVQCWAVWQHHSFNG